MTETPYLHLHWKKYGLKWKFVTLNIDLYNMDKSSVVDGFQAILISDHVWSRVLHIND